MLGLTYLLWRCCLHPTPTHATFASAKPYCHPPHSLQDTAATAFPSPGPGFVLASILFSTPLFAPAHPGIAQVVFSLLLQFYQPGRASGGRRAQTVEDQLPSNCNCINKPYNIYIYIYIYILYFFLLLYIVNGCVWPDRIFLQTIK